MLKSSVSISRFIVILSSFILLGAFSARSELPPDPAGRLPERLNGLTESVRKIRCASAVKREEILSVTVENPGEFGCVGLYLEMFGALKAEEYLTYILEVHGKRYGEEIPLGYDSADLFLGKKTPRLFPQLYVLLIRFSTPGKGTLQRLSDKYIELWGFRFDEVPKWVRREALKDGVFYDRFLQHEEVYSEEGTKTYTNQILRILTEDTLLILSGINLSEKVWEEILAEVRSVVLVNK